MKKLAALITIIMLLFCLTVMTACNVETNALSAPINIRFDAGKDELVWDEVPFATGGYQVEIDGNIKQASMKYWYQVGDLTTGDYTIRIRALTIDNKYYQNSEWSKPYIHKVKKESGITYRLINDGAEYEVESIGSAKNNIVIFDNHAVDGKPITSIGAHAFANNSNLTSITLGANIKYIKDFAFASCSGLKSIVIPEGLLSIGAYAFNSCVNLNQITLPDSLIDIGTHAFENCTILKSIKIPDLVQVIPSYAFFNCAGLTNVTFGEGNYKIDSYAFYNCVSLADITIPGSIQEIGQSAFIYAGLVRVTIEEGVSLINAGAFYMCKELVSVSIPSSVIFIGPNVFLETKVYDISAKDENNKGVVYVSGWAVGVTDMEIEVATIREGTVGIASQTFFNCTKLATATIPDSVISVGEYAFHQTDIWEKAKENSLVYVDKWLVGHKITTEEDIEAFTSTYLDSETKGIADLALANLSSLQLITSGGTKIKSIGRYAFYRCAELKYEIPESVKYIGDYAFYWCTELGNITLPENIRRIGDYTFYRNSLMTEIAIPKTVKYIGEGAFMLTDLNELDLPEGLTTISNKAFYGIETNWDGVTLTIDLPESVRYIGDEAFAWSSKIGEVIMKNVEYIGVMAFFKNGSLQKVTFNEGLRYISDKAFVNTGLKEVVLPDTVIHLGDFAFAGEWGNNNPVLERVVLSKGLLRIGRYAFFLCENLKSIVIPNNIRSLGDYAFACCTRLETIVIPKSVIGMGMNVFFDCNRLAIMCETTIRPEGWSPYWNSRDYMTEEDMLPENLPKDWDNFKWFGPKVQAMCPIIWGCQLSEDKDYVVSFTKHTFAIYNYNGIDISAPVREGYTFVGWSLIPDGKVADYTVANFWHTAVEGGPAVGLTLYAIWEEIAEPAEEA